MPMLEPEIIGARGLRPLLDTREGLLVSHGLELSRLAPGGEYRRLGATRIIAHFLARAYAARSSSAGGRSFLT